MIRRGRIGRSALIALGIILASTLSGCALWSLRDDARMRQQLQDSYPGFRVTELSYQDFDAGPFSMDAPRTAYYLFWLESEAVPGFKVSGHYYLTRGGGSEGWGPRESMFDRTKLTEPQLVALERLWVRTFPSVEINVGDDSFTGLARDAQTKGVGTSVAAKYEGIPMDNVYVLSGDHEDLNGRSPAAYFQLDRANGQWRHLPGYLRPD
jgi:hypothetical protein